VLEAFAIKDLSLIPLNKSPVNKLLKNCLTLSHKVNFSPFSSTSILFSSSIKIGFDHISATNSATPCSNAN